MLIMLIGSLYTMGAMPRPGILPTSKELVAEYRFRYVWLMQSVYLGSEYYTVLSN